MSSHVSFDFETSNSYRPKYTLGASFTFWLCSTILLFISLRYCSILFQHNQSLESFCQSSCFTVTQTEMPSTTVSELESQIKNGVDSLEEAMHNLVNTQLHFLTRLRSKHRLMSATPEQYQFQKDVSSTLFEMSIALELSKGQIPCSGSANLRSKLLWSTMFAF